jgi:hypothetical protein
MIHLLIIHYNNENYSSHYALKIVQSISRPQRKLFYKTKVSVNSAVKILIFF